MLHEPVAAEVEHSIVLVTNSAVYVSHSIRDVTRKSLTLAVMSIALLARIHVPDSTGL